MDGNWPLTSPSLPRFREVSDYEEIVVLNFQNEVGEELSLTVYLSCKNNSRKRVKKEEVVEKKIKRQGRPVDVKSAERKEREREKDKEQPEKVSETESERGA